MSELNLNLNEDQPLEPALPGTAEKEVVLAGFSERFLAYVIDTLPFWFLIYFTYDTFSVYSLLSGFSNPLLVWKILWVVIFFIYEIIFSSGGRATLGKKIMGIRVQSSDGSDLSVVKAFLRTVGYFISSYTINMGYIMALFTPGKKALHDYISGSRVIKVRERGDFAEGTVLVVSWALMAFFAGNWIQKTVLAVSPSEQVQINRARRTISKLARLEEIHFQKYGFYTDDIKRLADLTRNIPAVRKELSQNLSENSLEIASNGKNYLISAQAKNWRKTKVEVSNLTLPSQEQQE
ncbi:MAG: hypothetical protein Fur0012_12190 [Elusimicrobiota bacterium]